MYTVRRYMIKLQKNLQKFIKEGTLFQDDAPCYYIYRLIMNGRTQTGLGMCIFRI